MTSVENMEGYVSQREAIDRNAARKGIKSSDVLAYFDATLERARRENPGKSSEWYLRVVDYCVWEYFFHGEPFPGKIELPIINSPLAKNTLPTNIAPVVKTEQIVTTEPIAKTEPIGKTEPVKKNDAPRGTPSHPRLAAAHYSSLANRDWVHDLYEPDGLDRSRSRNFKPKYGEEFDREQRLAQAERVYGPQDSARVERLARHAQLSRDERLPREGDFYRPNEAKYAESSRRGEPSKSESLLLKGTRESYGRLSRPELETNNPPRPSASDSKYESQAQLILKNTAELGYARPHVEQAFKEESARIAGLHPNKSSDWQKWATEWAVWSRFLNKKSRFPGVEPLGQSKTSSTPPSKDGAYGAVKLAGPVNPTTLANQTEATEPVRPVYYMQEKKMEDLAVQRKIRKEFFSFLQKARDQARKEHRNCSPEIRHFVADKLTWMKFFSDLPFQGTEPKEGHSGSCTNRFLGVSPPKAPRAPEVASQVRLPIRPIQLGIKAPNPARAVAPVGQPLSHQPSQVPNGTLSRPKADENVQAPTAQAQAFQDTQPSLNMLLALGIARHSHERDGYNGGIVMVGSKAVFGEFRKTSEIFDHLITDSGRSVVICETLQCAFRYHRTPAGHLFLWATSDVNDNTAVERGQAFLQGWVTRALVSGMIRPFGYWTEMCRSMFSTIKIEHSKKPQDFQAATACWEEYKNVTGASPVDCLLVAEAAKGEGELRMVLDKVTEEIVTIKELLKRDRYRSSNDGRPNSASENIPAAPGTSIGEKRKMDDDDEILPDADAKRLCM